MKKSLKITHIIAGHCGKENKSGVAKSVYSFIVEQVRQGLNVCLICVTNKIVEEIEGVEVISLKLKGCSLLDLMPSSKLSQAVLRSDPDMIHLHSAYVPINISVGRIARSNKIPYVVTPHGNLSPLLMKRRPYLKYPYKYLFEQPLLRGASFLHVIADSEDVINYGVVKPMVTAVNGIDCPEDFSIQKGSPGLQKFNIPTDRINFLYLGRLDVPQKGLDTLLRGFALAYEKKTNLHLILAGSDWDGGRSELEAMVTELNLEAAVTFTSGVFGQDKHGLFRDSNYFVHISRWEAGIPFSVLEALSYGKIALVTKKVDRDSQLEAKKLAVLVEQNATSVCQGLLKLAATESKEVEKIKREAREFLKEDFSWEASTEELIKGYVKYS